MARPQEFDKQQVLNKAMKLFWQKGFVATSLSDLLAATGLSKSSLYATFGSKHELMLSALDNYPAQRDADKRRGTGDGNARAGILAFFEKIVEDARAEGFEGCMSINEAVELAPHDPEVRERVRQDFATIETILATAIARGQTDGSVATRRPPNELARLLTILFPGMQVMARSFADGDFLRTAIRQIEILLDS